MYHFKNKYMKSQTPHLSHWPLQRQRLCGETQTQGVNVTDLSIGTDGPMRITCCRSKKTPVFLLGREPLLRHKADCMFCLVQFAKSAIVFLYLRTNVSVQTDLSLCGTACYKHKREKHDTHYFEKLRTHAWKSLTILFFFLWWRNHQH